MKNPLAELRLALQSLLATELSDAGIDATSVQLIAIEPPRAPGYSSPVFFDVASLDLKSEFDRLSEEIGRKQAKKVLAGRTGARANELSQSVVHKLEKAASLQPLISRVESEKGYVNFYFDIPALNAAVLESVSEFGSGFGQGEPNGERVMVEYSQPNTHKVFHVGHTRNVALGIAISNILEFAGFPVVRANYIGDIGAHVIKCLWAMDRFTGLFDHIADPGKRLGEYYSLADKAENGLTIATPRGEVSFTKEEFAVEIRAMFALWEAGDAGVVSKWKETRAQSLESFERIYKLLGAKFDHVFYESDVEAEGKDAVDELVAAGIAEKASDGEYKDAVYVDFEKLIPGSDLKQMVVLRADGTSLYQTKELALAKRKFSEFDIERAIYIVACEQSFYFKQIFAILKLWGFPQADKCVHLPYEIVTLPEGKMSSRSGTVVLFDDLLDETLVRLESITVEKGYATDSTEIALKIAIGAIKFSMLNVDHNKVVVFDWEKALNFSGQAGPYVQYMAVRANRIIDEAGDFPDSAPKMREISEYEQKLALAIARFPDVAALAAEELAPYHLTRYAFELAQRFGEFYRFCPVLRSDEPLRSFRLSLVKAFSSVLESSLRLLGIEIPQAM